MFSKNPFLKSTLDILKIPIVRKFTQKIMMGKLQIVSQLALMETCPKNVVGTNQINEVLC
jgi:hypothetical protein